MISNSRHQDHGSTAVAIGCSIGTAWQAAELSSGANPLVSYQGPGEPWWARSSSIDIATGHHNATALSRRWTTFDDDERDAGATPQEGRQAFNAILR
jgi:hypothetical protein